MTLVVVFGSTPQLAWLELQTLVPNSERISDHTAVIYDAKHNASDLIEKLGGAIKIGRLASVIATIDASTLTPTLAMESFKTFGISTVDIPQLPSALLTQIKKNQDRPVRFIAGQLSSVVIDKQHVCELVVFPYRGKFGVAVTAAVQDYESWIKRDRGRPHADPRAGMLPPKVARMMVNIALRQAQGKPGTLLDPFCGMGTILAEGHLTGWQVVGSDQSPDATKKAEANLTWLLGQKQWELFTSDATHVSDKVQQVDAIVTEPFMGNPNVSEKNIANTVTGLEKLYIGCLKDWRVVLKAGGKLVMVFPRFVFGKNSYFVKKVIDSCETLGYTVLAGPIEYARPNAIVRREIYLFKKV